MDIAVVGSNMVDLVAYIDQMPAAGETLAADGFAVGCGGKGANQAAAAAMLGSNGALHRGTDGENRYPAPRVDAVDSTGAGDAFVGCFAQTLVQTGDVATAIRRAVAYASDSVTRRGTQSSYADGASFVGS